MDEMDPTTTDSSTVFSQQATIAELASLKLDES